MLQCTRSLVDERSSGYVVHRSNAALAALSAFLDVSSLNLAVLQGTAIFAGSYASPYLWPPTRIAPQGRVPSPVAPGPIGRATSRKSHGILATCSDYGLWPV